MTARESVLNKALSGLEIREILRADFERLLDAEGLLSHYLAYGRIGYDLTLRLHLDNPYYPESEVTITSKASDATPLVAPTPLTAPSAESVASGANVHRNITSPNEERLRHGLTLPVQTRGADGTVQIEQVRYPPQPDLGPGDVALSDTTKSVREAWKIPVSD